MFLIRACPSLLECGAFQHGLCCWPLLADPQKTNIKTKEIHEIALGQKIRKFWGTTRFWVIVFPNVPSEWLNYSLNKSGALFWPTAKETHQQSTIGCVEKILKQAISTSQRIKPWKRAQCLQTSQTSAYHASETARTADEAHATSHIRTNTAYKYSNRSSYLWTQLNIISGTAGGWGVSKNKNM